MSVIVKGMDMTGKCESCLLRYRHHGAYYSDYCYATPKRKNIDPWTFGRARNGDRPDWCPLRPLPEKHGRLVDVDALDTAFTGLRFNDDGTLRHWDDRENWCLHGSEVEKLIADAPTIVEAEGE